MFLSDSLFMFIVQPVCLVFLLYVKKKKATRDSGAAVNAASTS